MSVPTHKFNKSLQSPRASDLPADPVKETSNAPAADGGSSGSTINSISLTPPLSCSPAGLIEQWEMGKAGRLELILSRPPGGAKVHVDYRNSPLTCPEDGRYFCRRFRGQVRKNTVDQGDNSSAFLNPNEEHVPSEVTKSTMKLKREVESLADARKKMFGIAPHGEPSTKFDVWIRGHRRGRRGQSVLPKISSKRIALALHGSYEDEQELLKAYSAIYNPEGSDATRDATDIKKGPWQNVGLKRQGHKKLAGSPSPERSVCSNYSGVPVWLTNSGDGGVVKPMRKRSTTIPRGDAELGLLSKEEMRNFA